MTRSAHPLARRRPSIFVRAAGGIVVVFAVFVVVTTLGTETGCATQETSPAPDAAPVPCARGPFTFDCNVVSADEPGCNTGEGTSPLLARLPASTRYSVNCVANFVGDRDEQGDCKLDAVCKCLVEAAPPPPDAGEDAEAPLPSTPPPPTWNCSPAS